MRLSCYYIARMFTCVAWRSKKIKLEIKLCLIFHLNDNSKKKFQNFIAIELQTSKVHKTVYTVTYVYVKNQERYRHKKRNINKFT